MKRLLLKKNEMFFVFDCYCRLFNWLVGLSLFLRYMYCYQEWEKKKEEEEKSEQRGK